MFWSKKRRLDDLAEEIQSHIAHEADQLRESGKRFADPDCTAHRTFGNVTSVQEAFYEHGRWLLWDRLSRDLRHALRLMRRRPGFSAVVILTLALGIGANTAIFSVINAVLLRPLPYRDPSRLGMLWGDDPSHDLHEGRVSLLNFRDWKNQNQSFEDLTIFIGQTFLLGTDGAPERMRSARVPANFFPLLGVKAMLGRVFSAEEEKRGERVVVLSHGLWLRQFGGSARAVGSELVMDGRKSRVIGVMPAQFIYPFTNTQVWEPLTTHPYWASRDQGSPRSNAMWYVLGRLKPRVTWADAEAEMNTISHRLQAEYPDSKSPPHVSVVPLHTQTIGKVQRSLWLLFGSVVLMLLISCTNVAGLLMARGSVREREFAVRRALGAGRLRLAGQLITETVVLSAVGGLLGLLLAEAGLKALIAFGPQDIPRLAEARIDLQVLAFAALISLFAALVSSVWPAFQSSTALARSRQWTTVAHRGVRNLLVVGEFSLALVLLTGAGLLVHSFLLLQKVDPGFRPNNLLLMRIDLHVGRTADQQVVYFHDAIERLQAMPGIRSAAAITDFLRSDPEGPVAVEGRPPARSATPVVDDLISGPYFQTSGIPLRKGRFFSDQDRRDSPPVAIVNETMARVYWPNDDPIGQRFRFAERKPVQWYTVVGVVGDMRRQGIENQAAPQVFRPHSQDTANMMDVIVRTASDPLTMASAIQSEIQSMDKKVAKFGVTTVDRELDDQVADRRFDTSLIGLFSIVALFLSAIGIYGLMHHFVVQRTNEIGIRMALGARYKDVLVLILRQGLTLAGVGITIGIPCAFGLMHLLSSLLYEITPTDPLTFAAASIVLLGVALLACWIPARRAAKIDPLIALRQE